MLVTSVPLGTDELGALKQRLASMPPVRDDAERVDRIRALDELKAAAAAAQLAEIVAFDASQRAAQAAAGVPTTRQGRGVAGQIALARRISPARARQQVGWAKILTTELPRTFAALRDGQVDEWRAMIVARETAWLSREDRAEVDALLASQLQTLGDRQTEAEAKRHAYRLDPHGYTQRLSNAEHERRVGLRPAPDVMSRLTALLPVAQGVACYASLRREADSLVAQGDTRTRGQLMADTLITRLTGQRAAADVPVEINLIMTDEALFGGELVARGRAGDREAREAMSPIPAGAGGDEPAHLLGYGPVPAAYARRLVYGAGDTPRWLRRLFRRPDTGQLAAMDSRRRCFTPRQRHYISLRDHTCRTPYCGAPIRHIDHVVPAEHGGPTHTDNGAGQCAACNYAKEAPGWRSRVDPDGTVVITTPTGHWYRHRPPDPPGTTQQHDRPAEPTGVTKADLVHASALERAFVIELRAA